MEENKTSGPSPQERISPHFSQIDLFPEELLSSTKNDTFDQSMGNSYRPTGSCQNDASQMGQPHPAEVLSTGSLKMGYFPESQTADVVDVKIENDPFLDGIDMKYSDNESRRCDPCKRCCTAFCSPCMRTRHPLANNPSRCQRMRYALMCPPHRHLGNLYSKALAVVCVWAVLWSLTGANALPGGNLFALLVLLVLGSILGYFVRIVCRGPALLGMLVVGFILRNVPKINIATDIDPVWSRNIVSIALVVILIKAGLGLDPKALRRLSCTVFRLAFMPCLAETVTVAIASHFLLGLPWVWGFMLGFVLGAVSPAVVVPSMLSLNAKGLGVEEGIPTLVIAAASVDDVFAISGFGVLLGIAFSTGNIWITLIRGPLEALAGVVYGCVLGVIFWYLPPVNHYYRTLLRFILLLSAGLFAVLGSTALHMPGAGALGCLSVAYVASLRYRKQFKQEMAAEGKHYFAISMLERVFDVLWCLAQPLLFGLIGAEVDISNIELSRVGMSCAVLAVGLCVRSVFAFSAVLCAPLNMKERLFIVGAWLPKATVQAAIGAIALNTARIQPETAEDYQDNIDLGNDILTMAVLSIVITAPLGAVVIAGTAPCLLRTWIPPGEMRDVDGITEADDSKQDCNVPC